MRKRNSGEFQPATPGTAPGYVQEIQIGQSREEKHRSYVFMDALSPITVSPCTFTSEARSGAIIVHST